MRPPLCFAITALLAATANAQGVFIPPIANTTEGNDISSYPFGFTQFRSQLLLDQSMVAPNSAVITAIAFRADNDNSSAKPAVTVQNVTIDMSHSTVATGAMSTTYALNVTGTPMTVFTGSVSMPAYTPSELGVAPWFTINLDTPFAYNAANGNLLIDITAIDVNGSQRTNYSLDTFLPGGNVRSFGNSGVPSGGGLPERITVSSSSGANGRFSGLSPGGSVDAAAGGFFAAAPNGFFMIGTELMPPLDLTALGMPTSTAYVNPVFFDVIFPSGPLQRWLATYPLPNSPNIVGGRIFSQSLVQDAGYPAGYYATTAQQVTIGVATVQSNQLRGQDPAAATGFLDKTTVGGGPAMQLSGTFQ